MSEKVKQKRREEIAYAIGIILSCFGWAIFVCSLIFAGYGSERTAMMVLAGIIIIPGWLLLRFAGGLFPFGSRMFGWEPQE